jgi:hypothetical protein
MFPGRSAGREILLRSEVPMTELPGPSFCSTVLLLHRGSPPQQLHQHVSIYRSTGRTGIFQYLSPAYHGPDPHATAVTSRLGSPRPCAKVRGSFVGVVAVVGCSAGTVSAPTGSTAEVAVRTGEAVIFGMTLCSGGGLDPIWHDANPSGRASSPWPMRITPVLPAGDMVRIIMMSG